MTCTLTLPGGITLALAGSGRGEGTSGLRMALDEGAWDVAAVLRAKEPLQRDRGNRLTTVSFQSRREFATVALAEAEVLGLPAKLLDQSAVTATLTGGGTTLTLHQVAATVEAAHFGATVTYNVSLRGRQTA